MLAVRRCPSKKHFSCELLWILEETRLIDLTKWWKKIPDTSSWLKQLPKQRWKVWAQYQNRLTDHHAIRRNLLELRWWREQRSGFIKRRRNWKYDRLSLYDRSCWLLQDKCLKTSHKNWSHQANPKYLSSPKRSPDYRVKQHVHAWLRGLWSLLRS